MSDAALNNIFKLIDARKLEQARVSLLSLVQRRPRDPGVNSALSTTLAQMGMFEQAIVFARRAAELLPDSAEARFNLASMLSTCDRHDEAIATFRAGLELSPSDAKAHHALALAQSRAHRYADALATCESALRTSPGHHDLLLEAGHDLLCLGRARDAVRFMKHACELHPESFPLAQMLAFASNYDDAITGEEVTRFHRAAGGLLGELVPASASPSAAIGAPGRPLRVALASPDLRNHAVARFLEPMLRNADRSRVRLICYYTTYAEDDTSRRLRSLADEWHHVFGVTFEAFAQRVRSDGVDVFFDLCGYTAGSLLSTTPYRPAPLIVSYLGYPASTGAPGVHARFVDSLTDPPGSEHLALERLVRIDPCFLCLQPPTEAVELDPGEPPSLARGRITFGSFNAFPKISDTLLGLWSELISRVPGSRLVIKNYGLGQSQARDALVARLAAHGIDPARVSLLPHTPTIREHFRLYNDVDIALDTFPYHGTTTTCDALIMGVPVVSLVGDRHAARVGLSLLSAVGLGDLCAREPAEYVALAGALAADQARLRALRATLRGRVLASPLCDGPAFARRFVDALRALWAARVAGTLA